MRLTTSTAVRGVGFFSLIRRLFIIIAVLSLIFNAVGLWNEYHEIEPILKNMGDTLNPVYTLSENGQEFSQNGLFENTGHFFNDIWNWIKNVYSLIEPIIIIYLWLYYINLFCVRIIFKDKSVDGTSKSWLLALILFFMIQFIYIGTLTDLPLKTPFTSIGNLIKIIKNIFS